MESSITSDPIFESQKCPAEFLNVIFESAVKNCLKKNDSLMKNLNFEKIFFKTRNFDE